jgi:hypothetical protein
VSILGILRIIGQRSHLKLRKRAIYNPIKKPAKIIYLNQPKLSKAASQDFQAVLVEIGQNQPFAGSEAWSQAASKQTLIIFPYLNYTASDNLNWE